VLGATLVAAAFVLRLAESGEREPEPWRIEWPRVPARLRGDFARVGLTAATVWATLALYLSIVPSYASALLRTRNLALLAAIATVALVASCVAQIAAQRGEGRRRRDQSLGLVALALGLGGLVLASPLHSLTLLLAGAVAAGAGHGLGFLNAQQELNELAPPERRGEVTAAFISVIYLVVASAVIASGLLDLRFSLSVSVGAVALALVAAALAIAGWNASGHDVA
jgi:MFS family permease